MSNFVVAKRYAKALYASAEETANIERVSEELRVIVQVFEQEREFRDVLSHPSISVEEKFGLIQQAFGDHLSEIVYSVVRLLIERGRLAVLPSLYQAFTEIADERSGRAKALVYSAHELSEADSKAIAEQFGKITGKQIVIDNIVDRSLIGGIRVRIGDRLYEGSVAGKLEILRKQLKQNA